MRGGRRPDRRDAARSRGPRASSRPTGLQPARASSSAARAEEVDAALRAVAALGGEFVIEELLDGRGGLAVRALPTARARRAARSGAGLQAGRRRRHGPEHGRDGRLLAGRRGSTTPTSSSTQIHQPVVDELARRGHAVRRLPVRRADADRGRPEGARVQRALRRPGDAGADAARSRATCSSCWPQRPSGDLPGAAVALSRGRGGDGRAGRPRLPGAQRLRRRARSRASRRPRRRARSSSTAARRCATARVVTNGGRILSVTGDRADCRGCARTARMRQSS